MNKYEYGTNKLDALTILEHTLNMKAATVYKVEACTTTKSGTKRVLDEKESTLALEKQKKLVQNFQEWVWKDPYRKAELIDIEEITSNELYSLKVIKDDGTILFATELGTPHAAWNSYWLYQNGDVTGVLEYNPSEFQGLSNYYYKLYTLYRKHIFYKMYFQLLYLKFF